jgi:hypothetical protein
MKKFVTCAVALAMSAMVLSSCSGGAGGGYKTGLGIVTSTGSSAAPTADKAGKAQVDSTIAVVTIDGSGKITKCTIDVAQTAIAVDTAGQLTPPDPIKSKLEKGDAYGMKKASGIGKEWYEQANAFSQWCIGKTVDQVTGLKVKDVGTETGIPDVPELTSSVTISSTSFTAAVQKAVANAK